MTIPFQSIKALVLEQMPGISDASIVNMGTAYNVDPVLTGYSRLFKRLSGDINLLAMHTSLLIDAGVPAGRGSVRFRQLLPGKGEILEFAGTQYRVVSIEATGDAVLEPALQNDAPEESVFRRVALPIEVLSQLSIRAVAVRSEYRIVAGDSIQLGADMYRVEHTELNLRESDEEAGQYHYELAIDSDLSLDYGEQANYLLAAPLYVSEPIQLPGDLGPIDLTFPISTQFQDEFTLSVTVDLMAQNRVLRSYTQSTNSTMPLRFPVFEVAVPHECLMNLWRLEGYMDYNGSAVGLRANSMVEWREEFPTDQVGRWMMRVTCDSPGKLIVSMDNGHQQTLEVLQGVSSLSIQGPRGMVQPPRVIRFAFSSENPAAMLWIREMMPETIASYVRFSIRFESETLFRSDHMLLCGPKAQPSLPSVSLCLESPEKLDAGYLLRRI